MMEAAQALSSADTGDVSWCVKIFRVRNNQVRSMIRSTAAEKSPHANDDVEAVPDNHLSTSPGHNLLNPEDH